MSASLNKNMIPTPEQYKAIQDIAFAIFDAIKESGDAGIPSGHLYAALMGKMSLDQYNMFIGALVANKKITNSNHLLKAI